MFWSFLSPHQQIPVVADLPVGDNLQDHIFTTLSFKDNTNSAASVAPSMAAVLRYLVFRSGLPISKHFDKPAFVGLGFFFKCPAHMGVFFTKYKTFLGCRFPEWTPFRGQCVSSERQTETSFYTTNLR